MREPLNSEELNFSLIEKSPSGKVGKRQLAAGKQNPEFMNSISLDFARRWKQKSGTPKIMEHRKFDLYEQFGLLANFLKAKATDMITSNNTVHERY